MKGKSGMEKVKKNIVCVKTFMLTDKLFEVSPRLPKYGYIHTSALWFEVYYKTDKFSIFDFKHLKSVLAQC